MSAEQPPGPERTPEDIKAEIEATREELADTVSALAEKTDVKAQARKKVEETKESARERIAGAEAAEQTVRENPVPAAAIGALLLGFLLGWLIARRS